MSSGWDNILASVIKDNVNTLAVPLTHLVNLSFCQGLFPDELKIAKVLPLYKNDDPKLVGNYRPVSVLPIFSKIYERILYNRLIKFINKHEILYKYQFGFREKHNTTLALLEVTILPLKPDIK